MISAFTAFILTVTIGVVPAGQAHQVSLETNAYPNLAAEAELTMNPKPNYGPPTYPSTCNDPGDKKQLSDGEKAAAHYADLRSVGWMDSPQVILDYDLGALKKIGTLGVNIGAGDSGPHFPKKVRFYLGATPDSLRRVGEISTQEPYPNPENPKWHAKTVALNNLDRYARFVRIEFETSGGSLYLDEVMIVADGARPLLKSDGVAAATEKTTAQSTPEQTTDNNPVSIAENPLWTIEFLSPTPNYLHRGDTLRLRLTRKGPPAAAEAAYTSQMLLHGDTIYERDANQNWKTIEVNSQMQTVLEGRKSLDFSGNTKETVLELPLRDHPYGLFYLSAIISDDAGNCLNKATFRYQVLLDLPPLKAANVAGYDSFGWSYAWHPLDDPRNKPNDDDQRMLSDYGFGWAHIRNSWEATQTGPGKIQSERVDILDQWIESALRQQTKIVFTLVDSIPSIIGDDTKLFEQMYHEWAELFIRRYGDKVAVWEVWNEPDSKPYALKDGRDVFALRTVYELRNRYCPASAVITSTHDGAGLDYLARILQKGAGRYLDGIGLHPYRSLAPEIPEIDAFTGNPSGMATLLTSLAEARKLLEAHRVDPPHVYVTEVNYALNLQPQFDENDQANYMVRMNLLCCTTAYTKCLIHHALHNGRLAAVAYPNLTRHMNDATFLRRLDAGDDDVHAYLFQKGDGRVVLPIWSTGCQRLVKVSGLSGPAEVTDIYGNPARCEYDDVAKAVDFLEISQSPSYINAPQGSKPVVSSTQRLRLVLPENVAPGQTADFRVRVKSPTGSRGKLIVQLPADWNGALQSREIDRSQTCNFPLAVPADVKPGIYPLVASLLDNEDRRLSIVGGELRVGSLADASTETSDILSETFERGDLADWQVQENSQAEISVVADGSKVVQITQKGVDHAASLQRSTAPLQNGCLEFRWKASALGQAFTARLGELAIHFDGHGGCGLLAADGTLHNPGRYVADSWHKLRLEFSARDGLATLSLDGKPLGKSCVPANAAGYAYLRLLSGTQATEKAVSFRLDDIILRRNNAIH